MLKWKRSEHSIWAKPADPVIMLTLYNDTALLAFCHIFCCHNEFSKCPDLCASLSFIDKQFTECTERFQQVIPCFAAWLHSKCISASQHVYGLLNLRFLQLIVTYNPFMWPIIVNVYSKSDLQSCFAHAWPNSVRCNTGLNIKSCMSAIQASFTKLKDHLIVFSGLNSGSLADCKSSLDAGGGFFIDCSFR